MFTFRITMIKITYSDLRLPMECQCQWNIKHSLFPQAILLTHNLLMAMKLEPITKRWSPHNKWQNQKLIKQHISIIIVIFSSWHSNKFPLSYRMVIRRECIYHSKEKLILVNTHGQRESCVTFWGRYNAGDLLYLDKKRKHKLALYNNPTRYQHSRDLVYLWGTNKFFSRLPNFIQLCQGIW